MVRRQEKNIDFSKLTQEQKLILLTELSKRKERSKHYRLADFKPVSNSQEQVISAVENAVIGNTDTKIIWAN